MKKVLTIITGILMFVSVIGFTQVGSVEAASKNVVEDYNAPRCTISIASTVGLNKIKTGTIRCTDDKGFKDSTIVASDITIDSLINKKIQITNVVNTYLSQDGKVATWAIAYKGIHLGRANVKLRACALSDYGNNCNWASNTTTITTKLFG